MGGSLVAGPKSAALPAKRAKTATREAAAGRTATKQPSPSGNADGVVDAAVLEEILEALVAARDGDFSRSTDEMSERAE